MTAGDCPLSICMQVREDRYEEKKEGAKKIKCGAA
jgi:hypothetical protein